MTRFKNLVVGQNFHMKGTAFDLGKTYKKMTSRKYAIVRDGIATTPLYKVGTVEVEVIPGEWK